MRRAILSLAVMSLGLAGLSVPAPALAQQGGVLPADPQDFQCFVLLQQRRAAFMANEQLPVEQRAQFVDNLTIVSAFYAGRISHYSAGEAVAQFRNASAEIAAASPAQRDAFANVCTNFYVSVVNVLATTAEQAGSAPRQ